MSGSEKTFKRFADVESKLLLSQISEDCFEDSTDKLKNLLFDKRLKTRNNCFIEGIEFDESSHLMTRASIDEEFLHKVIDSIFNEAQQ